MRYRVLFIAVFLVFVLLGLAALWSSHDRSSQVNASVNVFASPVNAGCYIAGPNDCRIHVDPFTINLAATKRLVFFQLVTIQSGTGTQRVIYDFRPDQSNPPPLSGSTFTPSLVTQDFAATCGQSYELSLQGQDTGDASALSLGLTGKFTCPSSALP